MRVSRKTSWRARWPRPRRACRCFRPPRPTPGDAGCGSRGRTTATGAHRIVAIHRVEEDRLPVAARPVRRTRHLRHARQRPAGLARHAGQVFRPGGRFPRCVILSHPGLGLEHDLGVQRRRHLQRAVGRELQAALQHARRLQQRRVIGFVGDGRQGAVVVPAVDDQQYHHARQQQRDEQRPDAHQRHTRRCARTLSFRRIH